MTGIVSVVGCDPGPTSGFAFLDYVPLPFALPEIKYPVQPKVTLFQADGSSALVVLEAMLSSFYSDERVSQRFASVEAFRTGRSAGSKGKDADVTRQLVMQITETLQLFGYKVKIRAAAEVKPWATDKRLIAAGIKGSSGIHGKGRDAYDGSRQAIYCARWDAFLPDPLA